MLIEQVLKVLFELTIFALFAIIAHKLLKQYVVPLLYKEIRAIKKRQQDLKDKERLLSLSKDRLEYQLKKQEDNFVELEEKIKKWHDAVVVQNQKRQESNHLLLERIERRRKIQVKNLSLLKTEEFVIPRAIKNAYKEISVLFGGKRGEVLLNELIDAVDPEKK